MLGRTILFLILNFGALALGSWFTGKGVPSDWYAGLNKAPWTPPGWAFGVAWTVIMILFSFYMAILWPEVNHKNMLISLFILQWLLNVSWNPAFFYFHNVALGLLIIALLTLLVGFLLFHYWPILKWKSALILPYFIWLLVATSLNGYIYFKN